MENMIMQAHYLEALEIESKAEKPLADMERQAFVNTITELKAMISSLKLTIDTPMCARRRLAEPEDTDIP